MVDLARMMRRVALLAIHQLQSRFGSPCTYIYAYISWYILPSFSLPPTFATYASPTPVSSTSSTATMASWNKNLQPEGATTVSRFHQHVDIPSAATHPAAHTVFSARCEVTHKDVCMPTSPLVMSSSGSCLALAHIGDYKADRPLTSYWLPDPNGDIGEMELVTRLGYAIKHSIIDESRKLMFFADKHRIKSFHWDEGLPVHTMRSGKCNGPLAVLPGGKLARAGKGCAAIWNLDALQTHGKHGRGVVGENTYEGPEYSYMDIDDVEESTGSVAHAVIKFDNPNFQPSHWLAHEPTSYMLCTESRGEPGSSAYKSTCGRGFVSFDLAHGKTVSRYSGMDCQVVTFSASEGDPQGFAAAGEDGYARLYDIRQPAPKFKVSVDQRAECCAIALAHLDGIPGV